MHDEILDCLVIGGGAAGLTAAVYLGRYRRRAVLIDDGGSRIARIPKARNVIGFPDGIAGPELLERMRLHAGRYGTTLELGRVERLERTAGGRFEARAGSRRLEARTVLLATGATDIEPEIPGLAPALKAGVVRYCPICDGYETQGQRVAVLGRQQHGLREAVFVAGFDNRVTWLALGTRDTLPAEELERLRRAGVTVEDREPRAIRCGPRQVLVELAGGQTLEFDTLYPALGLVHACGLATALGARARPDGQLEVDEHYETTVPGLYAAGDVAVDLNQINVAAGQAAIAATAIHNRL
ncbi:NAD(P)/FAD-dependent oxidoreductase [Ramlibacter sp.]|uniref:NAD(P)/FAD-dependent oxidoreductase n=1 Tax=Ramlibacter sp. TaxID=1917967 RepID=UPI002C5B423D|nr:NAD(P)/FAD-dependent oxidoreductase [Ramlibacter sp.]HWI84111.1 NAD(P)/FAD-dependent oxidoreductase [Ramlibacter sp.]